MNDCASEVLESVFRSSDGYRFIHEITGNDQRVLNGIEINDAARRLLRIPGDAPPDQIPDIRELLTSTNPAMAEPLELALRGIPQRFTARIAGLADSDAFCAEVELRRHSVGSRSFLTSVIRNIEAQRKTEDELRVMAENYRTLAENLPLNIARWTPEGKYLYINPTHEKTLEKSRAEVVGTMLPDTHDQVRKRLSEVVRTKAPSLFNPQVVRDSQGRLHSHEVSIVPEFNPDGEIISVLGIGREITEWKRLKEDLIVQEQRFRSLLDNTPDNIACFDTFGNVLYLSSQMPSLLGIDLPSRGGTRLDAISNKPAARELQDAVMAVISAGAPLKREMEIRAGMTHEVLISPEITHTGLVVGAIAFARDVTERRRNDDELQRYREHLEDVIRQRTAEVESAREEAEAANAAKGIFLANMSHEIRTPLNAILGLTSVLQRETLQSQHHDLVRKIQSAGRHLLRIVNDILDFSKIEAGKFKIESSPFRVRDLFKNAHAIISERAESRNIRLDFSADLDDEVLIGDQTRLQQALLNYIANAIKFSENSTVHVRASVVKQENDRSLIRFDVEDCGVGISPAMIPRLFSPFEQSEHNDSRKHGGTGLGLAITKRLAELMGGSVGVQSEVGRGSSFWFTVCLRRDHVSTVAKPEVRTSDTERLIREQFAGSAILVVDDDALNREVAQRILGFSGLTVDCAEHGEMALEMLDRQTYSLVLMDMQMPVMNGLEATRRIRQRAGLTTLPVIAMTANAYEHDKHRCFEAGMDDILIKPFDQRDIFNCILNWLQQPDRRTQAN